MTAHSERDALLQSLVKTLCELLDAREGALYWLGPSNSGPGARQSVAVRREHAELVFAPVQDVPAILVASDPDFSLCLETGDATSSPVGTSGLIRHVHPLYGQEGIEALLELVGPEYAEGDARLVAAFLKIFRNYMRILDESERDTLTGLFNRRTFDRNLDRLLSQAKTGGIADSSQPERRDDAKTKSHWLAVLDIDLFKRVNDRFGHIYGDEVLILLSGIMRKVFRENDKLFRFGGEEFVVALAPTDMEGARNVLERLRKTVESYAFPQVGQVTVSIGFVRITNQDVPTTVIGHADEALYYAKQHGRNQVCSYDDLVSQNKIANLEIVHGDVELF